MKKEQNLKNFSIIITTPTLMGDREPKNGMAYLKFDEKKFFFEVLPPSQRKKNPILYDGAHIRVRATEAGPRFNYLSSWTNMQRELKSGKLRRTLHKEVDEALEKIKNVID